MGRGNSGRGGGKERVNRRDKTSRLGNNRDGLSDAGRAARDRDPDGNFDFNDHAWSTNKPARLRQLPYQRSKPAAAPLRPLAFIFRSSRLQVSSTSRGALCARIEQLSKNSIFLP